MKKLALMLAVLVALGSVTLTIAIFTFDADRYRPVLVRQLTQALGRPVSIGRLSLGWQGGLAIQAHDVAMAEDTPGSDGPPLQVESVAALIQPLALLRKRLEVSSIALIRPRIRILRDAQGQLNVVGLVAAVAPAAPSARSATTGSPFAFHVASLRMTDGILHWTDAMRHPPIDLTLEAMHVTVSDIAPARPMDLEVKGRLAGATLMFSGRLTLPTATSAGALERLQVRCENLSVELLMPAGAQDPQPRGKLTLTFQGAAPTLNATDAVRAVSGTATIHWAEPVVANVNLLREVFNRLSVIPGLVEKLEARLPPTYRAKLTATDTMLSPIDSSVHLIDGGFTMPSLQVETDSFVLTSGGRFALDGVTDIRSVLHIEPVLSAAIIASVNELQALANTKGELELPVAIQGQLPRLAVLPDLNYVASRVLVTKAVDVLGRFLGNTEAAPEQQTPQEPSSSDLLGSFLQRALQRQAPDESSSAQP